MFLLLKEFVTPVLNLLRDCLDAAGFFDGAHFDSSGVMFAQARVRHLNDGVGGVFVEAVAELLEDFDGRA